MGLRVRKSIKVAPGVKLNVGKKSVGVSVGGKHGGVSVNSKSGVNTRISVPGTGVSYTQHVLIQILYLIFDYPHKHYTFKYFEV